ncbi:MAG: DNA translocase FtsK [Candidatus Pacebacteria bacterium]|nr:DNA translocase FtsK [Candidatus Paceibacterota bacterium]
MAAKNNAPIQEPGETTSKGMAGKVVLIIFTVFALLILLSLVSYAPEDADYLAGGIEGYVIRNWIGYFGASVSWGLLLLLGFAAYPVTVVVLVSLGRRLFSTRKLRPAGWDYRVSFVLVSVGLAMLLGIWPDLWADAAENLNIARTPGGVVGQTLCAPGRGWMRMILNPTGSAIVAGTLVLVGCAVIWICDWYDLVHDIRASRTSKASPETETTETEGRLTRLRRRLAEKRVAREALKQQRRAAAVADPADPQSTTQRTDSNPKPENRTPSSAHAPAKSSPANATAGTARSSARARHKSSTKYKLPPLELLHKGEVKGTPGSPEEVDQKKAILQQTLDSFGIDAVVGEATRGPRVTLFEVLPAPGVKVERISRISNNIAMELRAISLRILTPIPGKKSVGIEVPNTDAATVDIRTLMETKTWKSTRAKIPLLLGRNISGKCVIVDLADAPHVLIAGATGSGKSVCINAMIMSLLYRFTPDDLRMILVDPKVVEFSCYKNLPHLVVPVITDSKKVPLALRWIIGEMERRYKLFAKAGARNITVFNARKTSEPEYDENGEEIPERVPYIILVIDELADIMMAAKGDVETSLARIAQLSRATGIHTIIATQRPSVNVITGIIKANYPTRVAFQVTSQVDSRTILDGKGAESLLGRGDMLFKPPGASKLERNQGALVQDDEIEAVHDFVTSQAEPEFDMDVLKSGDSGEGVAGAGDQLTDDDEELVTQAIDVIKRDRRATTSYVQRSLRIGYNRAAMVMEILEQRGIVGPQVGSAPREILIDTESDGRTEDEPDNDSPDESAMDEDQLTR